MARSTTFAAVLYIVLSTGAHAQLYEFLEALQPIVKSHPAFGDFPSYDSIFTTKKPKTINRHPTRQRTEEKKERKPAAISTLESYLRDDAKKKEISLTYSTTTRPVNKNANQRNEKPKSSSRNTAREIHSNPKENSKNPSRNVYDTLLVLDNINNEKRKHSEDKVSFVTRTTKRYENSTTKPNYSAENYDTQSNNNYNRQNYYNNYNPNSKNQSNDYIQFSNDEASNNRQTYNNDNQDGNNRQSNNNQNSQSSEYNSKLTNNNRQSNNNQNSQSSEYNSRLTNNNRQANNYNQDNNNRQSNNNQNSQSSEYNSRLTNNNRQTNNYNQDNNNRQSNNNQNSQSSEYNSQSNRGTNNNRQTNNYNQDSNNRQSNKNQNSQSSEYNSQPTNNRGSNNRHTNYNQDRQQNRQSNQNSQSNEYTQPNYNQQSNKPSKNYVLTTQNPFYNRPGVRPAAVDDKRPPITNRPPARRTTTLRPIQIVPKDTRVPPELITVPGEETMSEAEKLRLIDVSERMCSKYKKLYTKQLQAIPLVPSPEALEINVTSCTPTRIPLIVGGTIVTIKEFPHMALIGWVKLNYDGYAWRCGGSLISDRFVLTAAHCAYEERDNSVIMGTPRAVQLGSSFLDDPNAVVMKISTVIRHPKYKLPKSYYDIALIKMSSAVTFSEFIRPACLGVPPSPSDSIIATGWGRTEFGGDQSKELRGVSLEVWDMEDCHRALGNSRKLPNGPSADSQVCAGARENGKDTCQGDSGGPAQIQDGCVWRVVAVTSAGRACGIANTPALYAIAHRPFISSVVYSEQSISSEVEQIDLNEQRYHPSRSTETFNYQTNNWKSQRNTDNTKGNQNYNYNQQSNDYANNYEAYNQPYYNDAPTWF